MLLECKGTKDPRHSIQQLAHAGSQLSGLTVGHDVPPGLAFSSGLSDDRTWANALRTPQSASSALLDEQASKPAQIELDVNALADDPEFILEQNKDVSVRDLARVATRDGMGFACALCRE